MSLKEYTGISDEVRARVYSRDSFDGCPCCIICGRPYPQIHHYIERSRGGMGIEENLVCLCASCHSKVENGEYIKMQTFVREYLKHRYPDWDEKKLVKEKTYGSSK